MTDDIPTPKPVKVKRPKGAADRKNGQKKTVKNPLAAGAPKKEIDLKELEILCRAQCTLREIAAWFSVDEQTIINRMNDDPDFKQRVEDNKFNGKASLRRTQYMKALEGNVPMLIWMGKQLLDQSEKLHKTGDPDAVIKMEAEDKAIMNRYFKHGDK